MSAKGNTMSPLYLHFVHFTHNKLSRIKMTSNARNLKVFSFFRNSHTQPNEKTAIIMSYEGLSVPKPYMYS